MCRSYFYFVLRFLHVVARGMHVEQEGAHIACQERLFLWLSIFVHLCPLTCYRILVVKVFSFVHAPCHVWSRLPQLCRPFAEDAKWKGCSSQQRSSNLKIQEGMKRHKEGLRRHQRSEAGIGTWCEQRVNSWWPHMVIHQLRWFYWPLVCWFIAEIKRGSQRPDWWQTWTDHLHLMSQYLNQFYSFNSYCVSFSVCRDSKDMEKNARGGSCAQLRKCPRLSGRQWGCRADPLVPSWPSLCGVPQSTWLARSCVSGFKW